MFPEVPARDGMSGTVNVSSDHADAIESTDIWLMMFRPDASTPGLDDGRGMKRFEASVGVGAKANASALTEGQSNGRDVWGAKENFWYVVRVSSTKGLRARGTST